MLPPCAGCCLFNGGDPALIHPLYLLSAESVDTESSRFHVYWMYKVMEFSHSGFQSHMLWELVFSLWAPWCEGPFLCPFHACSSLPPAGRLPLPFWHSSPLNTASSLYLAVEFVLPVFRLLSGSLTWMWMICIHKCGTAWAQDPPTHHLPKFLPILI